MREKIKGASYLKLIIALFFILLFSLPLVTTEGKAGVTLIGGLSYEKEVQIDEIYQGSIVVRNNGDEFQEVKIYQTDYLFFCDGTNQYGEPGKIERSNAN